MLIRTAREVGGDRCLVAGNLSLTWMDEPGSPSGLTEFARPLISTFLCNGGEKPMSAYEYYDRDKLKAGE